MDTKVEDVKALRDTIARRIRAMVERWTEDTISLGKDLSLGRDTFPPRSDAKHSDRPGWSAWVKEEFGFTSNHANKLIVVYEKFANTLVGPNLSFRVLHYLASGDRADPAIQEVVERAKSGEKIGLDKAKKIIEKHLPSRKEAIQQARDTGKLVAARDGHMYSGASEDEMLAYSERRKIVYAIRRAVDEIAEVELTPNQWVNSAEDHWVHEFKLSHVEDAIAWLTKLTPLLAKRQKVVANGTR